MNIEQGLFKLDFTDYHAILGVSLEADARQIRKRYLKIARKLHPDSLNQASDSEKQQASEFLSKLVNPAYETLTQDKAMAEHKVVLRLQGQQLSQQAAASHIKTAEAKALLSSGSGLGAYNSGLKKLADKQYESLDQVLEITGQISELNLAYLVSSAGNTMTSVSGDAGAAAPSSSGASTSTASKAAGAPPPPPPPSPKRHRETIIDSYLNRAETFARRKDYSKAILEMREAVKSHPNSAPCHSQLASLYLQAGQATMARIHLKRALAINPNDAKAKQLEASVNRANQNKSGKGSSDKTVSPKQRGGLFGLFGGKQK